MMKGLWVPSLMVAWLAMTTACGGKSSTSPPSAMSASDSGQTGLSPKQTLISLSMSAAEQLCDWLANQYGGYGGSFACDGGGPVMMGPQSQSDCVAQFVQLGADASPFNTCTGTVSDFETCIQWQIDTACVTEAGTAPDGCAIIHNQSCSN
jgi:hypothetical protein